MLEMLYIVFMDRKKFPRRVAENSIKVVTIKKSGFSEEFYLVGFRGYGIVAIEGNKFV